MHYTYKTGRRNWNVIVMAAFFVVFGYSSYAMVIVRSMANTAIDMNNPEDPYKFYGYITREQYGDRPLAYGPYFSLIHYSIVRHTIWMVDSNHLLRCYHHCPTRICFI